MNTEQDMDGSAGLSKADEFVTIAELLEKVFGTTLAAQALCQINLTIGGQLKFFRVENLLRLNQELESVLRDRNLNTSELKSLPLSVGFPLLEKASYQENHDLQRMWANLLASSMENRATNDDRFSLDITYTEILHQLSLLDCEVLKYITEYGVLKRNRGADGLELIPLDPLRIQSVFPGDPAHISLEKLVNLGCAYRVPRAPISTDGGDGYGSLRQEIVVTLIGLNLCIATTGEEPDWY